MQTLMVPLRVGIGIIAEGKITTMRTITIIMGVEVKPSMMQIDSRSFNAEHVICGVILRRIVQRQTHPNYYADGADPAITKIPSVQSLE